MSLKNMTDTDLVGVMLLLAYFVMLAGSIVWLVASVQVLTDFAEYRSQQISEVQEVRNDTKRIDKSR